MSGKPSELEGQGDLVASPYLHPAIVKKLSHEVSTGVEMGGKEEGEKIQSSPLLMTFEPRLWQLCDMTFELARPGRGDPRSFTTVNN